MIIRSYLVAVLYRSWCSMFDSFEVLVWIFGLLLVLMLLYEPQWFVSKQQYEVGCFNGGCKHRVKHAQTLWVADCLKLLY